MSAVLNSPALNRSSELLIKGTGSVVLQAHRYHSIGSHPIIWVRARRRGIPSQGAEELRLGLRGAKPFAFQSTTVKLSCPVSLGGLVATPPPRAPSGGGAGAGPG